MRPGFCTYGVSSVNIRVSGRSLIVIGSRERGRETAVRGEVEQRQIQGASWVTVPCIKASQSKRQDGDKNVE